MRSLTFLLLAAPFLTHPISAQDEAAEKKKGGRGIRVTCMAIASDTPETLKIKSRNGIEDLPLSIRFAGEPVEIDASGAIVIGTPSADPKKGIEPLALGTLPESIPNAIVMLVPKAKAVDGLRYDMVFVDETNVRGGNILFMNATKHPAQAKVDDTPLQLPVGKPFYYHPAGLTSSRNARVEIAVKYNDQWQVITGAMWRLIPTRMEVCVVYWHAERNQPALKGITLIPRKAKS